LAFSDVNVVSDMASKKWYNLSYPSDDEPKKDKKDKSEPSTSDSIDNAYDAKDFKSTVKSLKGKVSDEDYNEIKDNLKALANLQYDLEDIDRDEDNEEWGMQKDTIDAEVDDLKGLIKQAISKSEPAKLKYGKDGKMTQDSADSVEKELNKALGVNGMSDIDLNTGTIEYVIDNDTDKAIFIGKEEGGEGIAVSFGDGGDEYKTFKNSKDAVAYAKELGKTFKGEEPKKDEPTKDSTKERAGNPKVNKVVSGKAKELGITPQKLGKEEYESRMSKAAVEALTDANFHSEARKLISILEDKPEWDSNPMNDPDKPKDVFSKEYDEWRKNTVFSSELYDSAEGTDEIAHLATNQSGWEGETSVDAIAFDLKMNGSKKLAAKIQSIFEGKVSNGFKNHSLKNLM